MLCLFAIATGSGIVAKVLTLVEIAPYAPNEVPVAPAAFDFYKFNQ